MDQPDVVVIGAGAAGLAAAAWLGRRGQRVVVLEARERVGGRIWTQHSRGWPGPVEMGAEFVHGGNAVLARWLRTAKVKTRPVTEGHWLAEAGGLRRANDAWERIDAVMRQIGPRFRGSFAAWLRRNGRQVAIADRWLAKGFVEGFQGAPLARMSARSLYETTKEEEEQARPVGGFGLLVGTLEREAREKGIEVRLRTVVEEVWWRRGAARVVAGGTVWKPRAVLVTLPLGVLRARAGETGAVSFEPRLAKERVWRGIEPGHAVRVMLRLRSDAWRRGPIPGELRAGSGREFGFLHGPADAFPVWWAEAPGTALVGWTGGPQAARMAGWTEARVVKTAVAALARRLGVSTAALGRTVVDARTHDWTADPFTRGAYSYSVAAHEDAPARLAEPVAGTLFFAGEATADSLELGTVHGALASGERAAAEILAALRRQPANATGHARG